MGHARFACSKKVLFCSGYTVRPTIIWFYLFLQLYRYSLLPALTVNGIIYSHIKEGAYNGDQFMAWLEGLLEVMNPYPAPNSVLILDNCRIHHVEGVEELCAQRWGQIIPFYNSLTDNYPTVVSVLFTYHPTLPISTQLRSVFHG